MSCAAANGSCDHSPCILEALWPLLDSIFDKFSLLSSASVDRILCVVWSTMCFLDTCPSWLMKAGGEKKRASLMDIIYLSLVMGASQRG